MAGGFPLIKKEALNFGEELGSGSFGAVYKAEWIRPGDSATLTVAVKRVLLLQKEAQNLNELRHKNIIRFYGVCESRPDFYIVTEFAPGGSLKRYLANKENPDLQFDGILRWAKDIISGVRYLHSEAPTPLIHRDLKSDNVVLSETQVAKLCDFGTAKQAGLPTTSVAGTAAWMSPEMMVNDEVNPPSFPTDIFSYGVILWEIVTRQLPFAKMNDFLVYMMVVEKGERLAIPSSCPPGLKALIQSCWREPKDRMKAEEIGTALDEMAGDTALSKLARRFLADKQKWLREIQEREAELEERALNLERQSRHSLNRSLGNQAPAQPADITHWDESDVAEWIRSIDISDAEFRKLSELVQTHCINGERLLLLSREDLTNLGVPVGLQLVIMNRRDEAVRQHLQHVNFPPLLDTRPQLSAKKRPKFAQISLSLVYGVYLRRVITRTSSGPHERWKPFVDLDVDDIEELEQSGRDPASLIQGVTFCFNKPHPREPFHVPATSTANARLPFAPAEWLIGLHSDEVSVIINYTDAVLRPRNTRFTLTASTANLGRTSVKQVDLTIKVALPSSASPLSSNPSTARLSASESFWQSRLGPFAPSLLPTPSKARNSNSATSPSSLLSDAPSWSNIAQKGGGAQSWLSPTGPIPPPPLVNGEPPATKKSLSVEFSTGWEDEASEDAAEAAAAEVEEHIIRDLDAHRRTTGPGDASAPSTRPKSFSLTPSFIKTRTPRSSTQHYSRRKGSRSNYIRSRSDAALLQTQKEMMNGGGDLSPGPSLKLDDLDERRPDGRTPNGAEAAVAGRDLSPSQILASQTSNLSLQIYGGNRKWIWSEDREDNPDIAKS